MIRAYIQWDIIQLREEENYDTIKWMNLEDTILSDASQSPHPLALNLSQHQGLFQ